MLAWLSSPLIRHYPRSEARLQNTLSLDAARGEKLSIQVAFRIDFSEKETKVTAAAKCRALEVQIRAVGYVPVPHFNTETKPDELDGIGHIPGYVPDPLLPETSITAGANETHAFWITVTIPEKTRPGNYPITVTLTSDEEKIPLTAEVTVYPAQLLPRQNFPMLHVIHADALCDWYKVELSQEGFWSIFERYLANYTAHGQDNVYVPIFTPPLDGVKRPTQLLGVNREHGHYKFDWRLVRRWVKTCREHGIKGFEWTHLFTQWGVRNALRVYKGHGETRELLWPPETEALSKVFRNFLAQFLPEFHNFLKHENLLECSLFQLSDEPHKVHFEAYRVARETLRESAPWMKIIDALSDIDFAREGLTDVTVPMTSAVMDFVEAGFDPWVYYCCIPRGYFLNRLLDTPLIKLRMSGWLFYRTQVHGFYHWGYNYWYKNQTTQLIDPFKTNDGLSWPNWAHGDPFVVYPGADGPIDSLRWEVFAESLQDYALLQSAEISTDDEIVSDIKNYAEFPRSESWLVERRKWLLNVNARR